MSDQIYEITGHVHNISDEWKNESGTFSKRSLILFQTDIYNGKVYENYIEIDFINQGQQLIAQVWKGNKVMIRFVLQGRLGKDKYAGRAFTSLKGIKIDVLEASTPEQASAEIKANEATEAVTGFVGQSQGQGAPNPPQESSKQFDDLPF